MSAQQKIFFVAVNVNIFVSKGKVELRSRVFEKDKISLLYFGNMFTGYFHDCRMLETEAQVG